MMFEAGAREVHMRISSSADHCIPTSTASTRRARKDLLAANMTVEQMRDYMGATSLAFLSVDGIYRAMGFDGRDARAPQFTDHCFTGDYPTRLVDQNGPAGMAQLSFLSEVR